MRGSSFHFPHFTDEDEIRRLSLVQFYTRGVTARLPTQLGLKTPRGWARKPQSPLNSTPKQPLKILALGISLVVNTVYEGCW